MKEYKTYWKKGGRKRNIAWEAKLARYLEHHTPLERIRHELFKAFDEGLDDYELYKEVEEEYSFYVKGYKLAIMDGLSADDIEFKLWDDAMISKKLEPLIRKSSSFSEDSAITKALNPWMTAVKKLMVHTTQAGIGMDDPVFKPWLCNWSGFYVVPPEDYVKSVLRPYLDAQGLQDAKTYVHERGKALVVIEYQGCQLLLKEALNAPSPYQCYFYPYAEEKDSFFNASYPVYDHYHIPFSMLTLSAIAKYVKLMPKYKDIIDNMKAKVTESYKSIKGE
jgi:hypothetical protein